MRARERQMFETPRVGSEVEGGSYRGREVPGFGTRKKQDSRLNQTIEELNRQQQQPKQHPNQ
jgi:hypothetical protein